MSETTDRVAKALRKAFHEAPDATLDGTALWDFMARAAIEATPEPSRTVAVQVGDDVVVFADGECDEAVVLVGRTLSTGLNKSII